ncbi:uncharacterized protein LOC128735938 [Sabethes cyaneus]|uniref:uncharacterized protein LOC128735938 n=1 Tax=Sabethes cyaneus TaxID=53552 RepID=UPI00237D6215|nr:uncharacterized protein LOC128735938 [Sabethes cyaneus]
MLGPNFNIQNKQNTPYIEVASEIEKSIRFKQNADDIRAEISNIMVNHINYQMQPRNHENDWIRKDAQHSKGFLKEHPELLISKADKGTQTVILSAQEYREKMSEMLEDQTTYQKLQTDPTNKIQKKVNAFADEWLEKKYIEKRIHAKLKMSSSEPPRIYGLPKIHKENRPLRPVVSTIGSATYNLAKMLTDAISSTVGQTIHHVRNSFEFANEITREEFPTDGILFSLDVKSLYTNVPIELALNCLDERWNAINKNTNIDRTSFLAAVKLVLESTYFVYDGHYHQQHYGVPMGSPLSPVIANVVMERLEQESTHSLQGKQVPLLYYRRYVDDCLCVAKEEHIQAILDTFNAFHERLEFTIEREQQGRIKFLDMMLTRENGKVRTNWLPKQTNGRYLDYTSESPFQHKCNTVIALYDRAIKLTNINDRPAAIQTATKILEGNSYPDWFTRKLLKQRVHKHYNTIENEVKNDVEVKYMSTPYVPGLSEKISKTLKKNNLIVATKPRDKIKNKIFSKLKDPIPTTKQKNVIYSIPCGAGDNREYIGQTGRRLDTRIAEHKNDAKKSEARTGLALHTIQEGHIFDFEKTRILEKIENKDTRLTAEMFHSKMRGQERTVNLQRECGNFNDTYNGLMTKLRLLEERKKR